MRVTLIRETYPDTYPDNVAEVFASPPVGLDYLRTNGRKDARPKRASRHSSAILRGSTRK